MKRRKVFTLRKKQLSITGNIEKTGKKLQKPGKKVQEEKIFGNKYFTFKLNLFIYIDT